MIKQFRMEIIMKFRPFLYTAAACVLLSACTSAPIERKRYFWPPDESQPKIEYINFYQVDNDILRGKRKWLEEFFLGKEQPKHVFTQPMGIVSNGEGKVYITDISRNHILVYDFVKEAVRPMLSAQSRKYSGKVWSIDLDSAGNLYGALSSLGEIVVIGPDEKEKFTFGKGELENPTGIAIDKANDRVLVVDSKKHQIVVFTMQGQKIFSYGQQGRAPGQFNYPTDIDIDSDGNIYVLDTINARVQVFSKDFSFLRSFGERGTASGSFMMAKSIAISPAGHVYVSDALAHRIVVFDRNGDYLLTFGGKHFVTDSVFPGGFYLPGGIDVDENNTIWIADTLNKMFHEFQYLDDKYLKKHPVVPGQAADPGMPDRSPISMLPEVE